MDATIVWDLEDDSEGNVQHLREHDVSMEEAEEVLLNPESSRALQGLKKERLRRGLSIADVSERSGLDRAVVSRLENGKQDNPTVATLMRYAAAVGKRFLWSYEDLVTEDIGGDGKAGRRTRRSTGPERPG